MKRIHITIVLALSSLIILAGCSGKMRYSSYYTLNLPAPPDPPPAENANVTVAIREFRAPSYLRNGAIVYKTSPESVGFYAYHRWAIDPCEFVTDSVMDRLRATGVFSRVQPYDGRPGAEYLISGRLEKLEEIDYEGAIKVEVGISAQMIRIDTGAMVWSNVVSEVGDVKQHDVPSVVAAMSRTMERAIHELLTPLPIGTTPPTAAKKD